MNPGKRLKKTGQTHRRKCLYSALFVHSFSMNCCGFIWMECSVLAMARSIQELNVTSQKCAREWSEGLEGVEAVEAVEGVGASRHSWGL